jgi:hypothetical protein
MKQKNVLANVLETSPRGDDAPLIKGGVRGGSISLRPSDTSLTKGGSLTPSLSSPIKGEVIERKGRLFFTPPLTGGGRGRVNSFHPHLYPPPSRGR